MLGRAVRMHAGAQKLCRCLISRREQGIMETKRQWFFRGIRNGIPIALGYFAVSFALGIAAKRAGLNALQATLCSALCNASAGEYAGFTVISAQGSYIELLLITLIVNARYLLMSASLSQKVLPDCPLRHRLALAFCITDEIFGASVTVPERLNPFYSYGLAVISLGAWSLGTCLGVVTGSILPTALVEALGAGLYGMFLAIIIPPARENRLLGGLVLLSMALSFLFSRLPLTRELSEGTRIILLTLLLSLSAALLFPIKENEQHAA